MCAILEHPDGSSGAALSPQLQEGRGRHHYVARCAPLSLDAQNVRVGSDDTLSALAVKDIDASCHGLSSESSCLSASGTPAVRLHPDKALIADRNLLASNPTPWAAPHNKQETYAVDSESQASLSDKASVQTQESRAVIEFTGKKRVFPPAPGNNPFKKRIIEYAEKCILFSPELDGELFGKGSLSMTSTITEARSLFKGESGSLRGPSGMAMDSNSSSEQQSSAYSWDGAGAATEESAPKASYESEENVATAVEFKRASHRGGSAFLAEAAGDCNATNSETMMPARKTTEETMPQCVATRNASSSEKKRSWRWTQKRSKAASSEGSSSDGLFKFFRRAPCA